MPCCTNCRSSRVKPSQLTWSEALHRSHTLLHIGHATHRVFPVIGLFATVGAGVHAGVNKLVGTCERCEDCQHVK